ncbi:TPA: EAL domain-containing protein [Escherichia coli]|nr:EAL domain-containing protein [Escherichia coli]
MLLTSEEFHSVLSNKSIIPFFQPIYNTEKNFCTGAEIVARLPYSDNRMLTPDFFLPNMTSVRSQRILTKTLLRKSLPLLSNDLLPSGFILTFNISANTIGSSWLNITCNSLLKHTNSRVSLVAEITEKEPLTMDSLIWSSHFESLRKSGVSIALDDFGVGYSNFLLLKQIDADYIKIPYEFISDMEHNVTSMYIVDSTIQLANILGVRIIAEGVETEKQYEMLLDKGVVLMQGFYFSPPLCLDDFIQHIKQY